jgi:predicted nucleotidyltransferase
LFDIFFKWISIHLVASTTSHSIIYIPARYLIVVKSVFLAHHRSPTFRLHFNTNLPIRKVIFRFSAVSILKTTKGVLGAWTFGSMMHGLSDEYSDIDLVILADGDEFYQQLT